MSVPEALHLALAMAIAYRIGAQIQGSSWWARLGDYVAWRFAHILGPMAGRVSLPDDEGLLAHEPAQRWHFIASAEHPRHPFLRMPAAPVPAHGGSRPHTATAAHHGPASGRRRH